MVEFLSKLCKNLEKIGIYPYKFVLEPPFLWVTFNTPVMKELDNLFIKHYKSDFKNAEYDELLKKELMYLFNLTVLIKAFNKTQDELHQLSFSQRRLHTRIISDISIMIESFEKFTEFIQNSRSDWFKFE
jgi:hypothetical protein